MCKYTMAKPKRRVAVIGAGPAGAIATDALVKEQAFDTVRVFERRNAVGGTWYVVLPPVFSGTCWLRLQSHQAIRPQLKAGHTVAQSSCGTEGGHTVADTTHLAL